MNDTIPACLQAHLSTLEDGRPVRVYNFGRGYFFSIQERVLFETLLHEGHQPDLAVFIDGGNDVGMWLNANGNPYFTNFFRNVSWRIGNPPLWSIETPLQMYIQQRKTSRQKTSENQNSTQLIKELGKDEANWQRMLDRWFINKRMTEALAAEFGINTLFVWQPVPLYRYAASKYHLLADQFSDELQVLPYQLFEQRVSEAPLDRHLLVLSGLQEKMERNLYVDLIHYNSFFNNLIAEHIARHIQNWDQP